MFRLALIAVLVATAVAGGCDNDCSGHGTCTQNGVCACWDNWGMGMGLDSGDCSQRICPFEFAWVDTPDKLGNHHRYAECSNRGICDRDSGECECFPGYEGKACARTTCPNDCSGHGRCKFIEDLPFQSTPQQFDDGSFFPQKAKTFGDAYKNWDASKTRGCQCDPEWGDVDCSKRMCQHGNDIMDQRNNLNNAQQLHVQHIQFVQDWHFTRFYDNAGAATGAPSASGAGLMWSRTFALTFTSKLNETFTTIPIVMPASDSVQDMRNFFLDVEHALEALPNGVIDNVKVNGDLRISSWEDGAARPWQVDTSGGNSKGDANLEISDRSADEDDTKALDGGQKDADALYINITFQGKNVQGPQNLLTVKHIACADGCTPKLTGLDLRYDTMNVTEIYQADYNSYECGRRGKCDYKTGICECFSGYSGLSCGTITSLV
jgi:hypothetical protein